jgi:hypothetical protein
MKIRLVESRTVEYDPDLEDPFYSDKGATTIEGALNVDREFFENINGADIKDLDDDVTIERKWQLLGDDGSVIATF